jgi:hypothetical protein
VEGIANHLDDVTVVGGNGGADEGFLAAVGRGHGGGVLFPEARAALDVGEQEGPDPGGDFSHYGPRGASVACLWFSIRYN